MSFGKKPTVFVSSTCYDLKQIRNDINTFIRDNLGYDVLMSEYESFPLDPKAGTVDNCLRAVDERADIFVLIVGCRYGCVTDTGHSITNLEYLKAKSKGIPIYAFVDNKILSCMPFWRDNPDGNFQSTVDTPKLFEFVDTFRKNDGIWSFGFDFAKDIINILKFQLGYLFCDCLSFKQKAIQNDISDKVRNLSGHAFQIALLHPVAWEHKLFAQVLSDELKKLEDRRRDFDFRITFAPSQRLQSIKELMNYMYLKLDQLQRSINTLSLLIRETLPKAVGAPGCAGNAEYIIYTANRIVTVYNLIIDWSLDFGTIVNHDECKGLVNLFLKMCETMLCDIEHFSQECCQKILSIPDNASEDETNIDITLELSPLNIDEMCQELIVLQHKYGLQIKTDF